MGEQIPLPELPPMKPVQSAPAPAPAAQVAPAQKAYAMGTRRLRQLVSYVGGASLGFVMLVCAGEVVLRDDLKPTALLATIEAGTDLGIMNIKMGHAPGEHVLNEAQYQSIIAQAQREGVARAELAFQRDLAVVQADKERVVGAYQTLYQRTNTIAQAGLQMEAVAQQFRQQLIAATNGGRTVVIGAKDILCGLGSAEACESARRDREIMIGESTDQTSVDLGAKIRELMSGIEDPAAFTVRSDEYRNGVPAIRRR